MSRWVLALGLLVYLAFEPASDPVRELDAEVAATGDLHIVSIRPLETEPGGAVVVTADGIEPEEAPPTATLDREPVEVIHRRGPVVVVRVGRDASAGRRKLRLHQGVRRSKGRDLWVEPAQTSKSWRNVLGGLALLVFGLRTLARGLRGYAGRGVRGTFGALTQTLPRGLGLGFLSGALTQSTISASALVVGMLESGLIALGPALGALLGAQFGAATMALLLPLSITKGALWLVALGVGWVMLARGRRDLALAKALLGIGFVFFGLQTLRVGFQPLVHDADVLDLVASLRHEGALAALAALGVGAGLAAVLQGPGPAFALLLGLVQSTGILTLTEALLVLSGTPLGAAVGTVIVAWPFGAKARAAARGQLVLGLLASLLLLASVPACTALSHALVPGDPEVVEYGKKILLPNVAPHLSFAFLVSQGAVAALLLALVPSVTRQLERRSATGSARPERAATGPGDDALLLAQSVERIGALLNVLNVRLSSGDRSAEPDEQELEALGGELRGLAEGTASLGAEASSAHAVALALLSVHRDLVGLDRIVEGAGEAGVHPSGSQVVAIERVTGAVLSALHSLGTTLRGEQEADVEAARADEIRINALEHDARYGLGTEPGEAFASTLLTAEVLAVLETIGNHAFRAHEALAEADDDF